MSPENPTSPAPRAALLAGGLAAVLASSCCLGPLLLLSLGFSGAWIGSLTALAPYRPLFIGVALLSLLLAWRRIGRPVQACTPGTLCATPRVHRGYRLLFALVATLVLLALVFPSLVSWFY